MKSHALAAALAFLVAGSAHAAMNTLYSDDYDGNEFVAAGVSVSGLANGGLEDAVTNGGWSGKYFANRTQGDPAGMSFLTLGNLTEHTEVSVSFLLGFLESWDGFDAGTYGPDNLDIYIDGSRVARLTATNALGSADEFGGGTVVVYRGQINGNPYYSDVLLDMSTAPYLTFAHTASTLTVGIQASGSGWQGGDDEGWGVDALKITYDGIPAVPEPSTWAMLGAGLAGLVVTTARRRTTSDK